MRKSCQLQEFIRKQGKLWDMTDQELRELIELIKQLPPSSSEYRKAFNKLLTTVSKELIKLGSYRNQDSDLHADALTKTIDDISNIIQKYNPTKGRKVLNWIKTAYKFKLFDLKKARKNKNEASLDEMKQLIGFEPSAREENEENEEDRGSYRRVVEQDPTGLLASKKLNYTNQSTNLEESLSLKEILLMVSNGKKPREICREFHIPQQSLYSFIRRSLKKKEIRNYFEKYSY